jgi:cell division protein FtsL
LGKKGDKKSFFKFCTGTIIVVSVLACFVSIIATQASLAEKREELQQLVNKTEEVRSQNQEYQQLFNEDINSYKEKLAIENMNYAYPNEIRFYDTSRN